MPWAKLCLREAPAWRKTLTKQYLAAALCFTLVRLLTAYQ